MDNITEKVKSFEDACAVLNINAELPDFSAIPEKHRAALLAHFQLVIIAEALNEGWTPNWDDDNEYKYYPWFDMEVSSSASGFSDGDFGCGGSASGVGSRLCFKTRELAKYAGQQFEALYKEYFVLK